MPRTAPLLAAATILTLLALPAPADQVGIEYLLTDLGGGRWQYAYAVTNLSLTPPVEEFTIWFQLGSYDNLAVTTPNPPSSNWDELVMQPDPQLSADGLYDALALSGGIDVSQMVSGFSVSFDWLGAGLPGPQTFEIINPTTSQTVFTGRTTPEPATLIVAAMLLFPRRTRRS